MHSVTRTVFQVFAFKVTHSRHTVWGHVPQVPQRHDASGPASYDNKQTTLVFGETMMVLNLSRFPCGILRCVG